MDIYTPYLSDGVPETYGQIGADFINHCVRDLPSYLSPTFSVPFLPFPNPTKGRVGGGLQKVYRKDPPSGMGRDIIKRIKTRSFYIRSPTASLSALFYT